MICQMQGEQGEQKPLTKESVKELLVALREDIDEAIVELEKQPNLVAALEFGENLAGQVCWALLQAGPNMGMAAQVERARIQMSN